MCVNIYVAFKGEGGGLIVLDLRNLVWVFKVEK